MEQVVKFSQSNTILVTQFLLMTQIIMTLTMLMIVKKDYNLYQVVLSIFQTIWPFIYSFHKNTSSVYSIPKVILSSRNNPFNEADIVPACLRVYREEVKDTKQIFAVKCYIWEVHSAMAIHCRSVPTSSNWQNRKGHQNDCHLGIPGQIISQASVSSDESKRAWTKYILKFPSSDTVL